MSSCYIFLFSLIFLQVVLTCFPSLFFCSIFSFLGCVCVMHYLLVEIVFLLLFMFLFLSCLGSFGSVCFCFLFFPFRFTFLAQTKIWSQIGDA